MPNNTKELFGSIELHTIITALMGQLSGHLHAYNGAHISLQCVDVTI